MTNTVPVLEKSAFKMALSQRTTIMRSQSVCLAFTFAVCAGAALAQRMTDTEIEAAMKLGAQVGAKKLWADIKKKQQFRINRAGFGDPVEKKITIIKDADRIALEAAEAKRQMRILTIEEVRAHVLLGVVEVLVEANCYNNLYAGSLASWGPEGGVHLVLKIGDQIIQPIEKRAGQADAIAVLPQEHGLITASGNAVTYTPLYRSAIYERASQRAWFTFANLSEGAERVTVTVISGSGKTKEKELDRTVFAN